MSEPATSVDCGPVQPRSRRTFGTAYWTALAGCLVSAGLTYAYVGGPVRELNPVLRLVIDVVGLEAMVALKVAVAVAGYWGYFLVGRMAGRPRLATGLGWVAAAVYAADALHDARVALAVGSPGTADAVFGGALVLLATGVGIALRPPDVI